MLGLKFKLLLWIIFASSAYGNEQCVARKAKEAVKTGEALYNRVTSAGEVVEGRIEKVSDNIEEVRLSYTTLSLDDDDEEVLISSTATLSSDDQVKWVEQDVTGIIGYDSNRGRTAELYLDPRDGEAYLTVNTSDAATSCRLKLSAHDGAGGGKIATKEAFMFLKFSPDGKYVAYVAEQEPELLESASNLAKPTIVIYDVDKVTFTQADLGEYVPGHLHWHSKENVLVGVAWSAEQQRTQGYYWRSDVGNR